MQLEVQRHVATTNAWQHTQKRAKAACLDQYVARQQSHLRLVLGAAAGGTGEQAVVRGLVQPVVSSDPTHKSLAPGRLQDGTAWASVGS